MSTNDIVMLNAAGIPSEDFIAEVIPSQSRKRNELYFALMVNGLPGDPTFGVGLRDRIFEQISSELKRDINKRLASSITDAVTNIRFDRAVISEMPDKQFVGIDIYCTDLESGKEANMPVALKKGQ